MLDVTCDTIPPYEMAFHPHSFADADGRLFGWRGHLYRGIRRAQSPFFLRLFQDGTIASLIEKGLLIDSQLTPLAATGFDMVVWHKTIPFLSYPQEWCAAMLKDAALLLLDLQIELVGKGLTLKDAHPWNVVFAGCKPVFVDLTSITPLPGDGQWQAYEEFCQYCYYPLILMTLGQERIARSLLPEYGGVQRAEVLALARNWRGSRFLLSRLIRRALRPARLFLRKKRSDADAGLAVLYQLRRDIEELRLPIAPGQASANPDQRVKQQEVLGKALSALRPASVVDVNALQGWGTRLAAETASLVISLGTDATAVSQLYSESRKADLPILPLILDFMKPTPSVGYSDHYLIAATERLKCEMVLALSLVRRAVYDYYLPFPMIVEGLALFSTRWVIVEFSPFREPFSGKEDAGIFPWYTLGNFKEALQNRFSKLEVLSSDADGSVLLLCEK
jgi:hypothetical protein